MVSEVLLPILGAELPKKFGVGEYQRDKNEIMCHLPLSKSPFWPSSGAMEVLALIYLVIIDSLHYFPPCVLTASMTGWVNRFANAGDTAMEVAENTAIRLRQAKTEIVSASKVAYRFLLGVTSNVRSDPDSPSNSNRGGSPRFHATWLKNLVTTGAKPSSSSEIQNQNGVQQLQLRQEDDGKAQLRHNSSSHDSS